MAGLHVGVVLREKGQREGGSRVGLGGEVGVGSSSPAFQPGSPSRMGESG